MESLYPFPDDVIIEDRPTARAKANSIFLETINRRLVMWVDGSVTQTPLRKRDARLAVSAVRYCHPQHNHWEESVALNSLSRQPFANKAEFIALAEAFRIASKPEMTEAFDHLVIMTDSQSVLTGLQSLQQRKPYLTKNRFLTKMGNDLVETLLRRANELYDHGVSVELRWVPGHSGAWGNVMVDVLAGRTRRFAERLLGRERPSRTIERLRLAPAPSSEKSLWQALLSRGLLAETKRQRRKHDGMVIQQEVLAHPSQCCDMPPYMHMFITGTAC